MREERAEERLQIAVQPAGRLDVAAVEGLRFEERPFTLEEAYAAREAFLSSATTIATPVVAIDGRPIGDGRPGPTTLALRRKFTAAAARS